MPRRLGGLVAAAIVQLVALVLAHDLVFLARYGSRYNEELVHTGHAGTWAAAVETSIVLGVLLAAAGVFRLVRLRLLLRGRAQMRSRAGSLPVRSLVAGWRNAAVVIAPLTVMLLTIQENIERWGITHRLPGPAILLTPEYAGGLWIAIGVGLAIAFVVALFRWRRETLLARLRAARMRHAPAVSHPRPTDLAVRPRLRVGRAHALRAPPLVS